MKLAGEHTYRSTIELKRDEFFWAVLVEVPQAGREFYAMDEPDESEFLKWCERWKLPGDWYLGMIKLFYPEDYIAALADCISKPGFPSLPRIKISFPGWLNIFETRAEHKAKFLAYCERKIDVYYAWTERRACAQGATKRPPARIAEHFRWLARYYVLGESTVHIWKSLNNGNKRRSYEAVKKSIRETAMEIGLSLRKNMGTLATTAEVPIESTSK